MYGLQGGAVNLILLLVSDIDDNFRFLTGHSTEKLVIINKTSFVSSTPPQSPSDPASNRPIEGHSKAPVGGDGGGSWRSGPLTEHWRRTWLGSHN